MRHNRRGQESKFLTGFPTLLLVVVLIGIFIGFSFTLAAAKGTQGAIAERGREYGNSFYQPINQPITIGTQEILVLDALLLVDSGDIKRQAFENGLYALLAPEPAGSCLVLALDRAPKPGVKSGQEARNDFYIVKETNAIRAENFWIYLSLSEPYRRAGVLSETSVVLHDGTRMYIEYYFGRCVS